MPRPEVIFVCSGQGGQWAGMGMASLLEGGAFCDRLTASSLRIRELLGWSLLEEMKKPIAKWRLHLDPLFIQPSLTALQVALIDELARRGIRPTRVIGLSMGEVAAAYAAGSLSAEQALDIVCTQARLTRQPLRPGGMVLVTRAPAELEPALALEPDVAVGVELSAEATVIAGEANAIARFPQRLAAEGATTTPIAIAFAFHTREMLPLQGEFVGALSHLEARATSIPFFSARRGGEARGPELLADHWWGIMDDRARFYDAVVAALPDDGCVFIEVGPQPILERSVLSIADSRRVPAQYFGLMAARELAATVLNRTVARLLERS